ncbi:MAG: acetyl-CoA carboxylase biotin carboxylase subunit [Methanospirillum sp.]|nr:acetyl-CoA carboxylase biotin carboxylase subunit [Methanospirillum sp.]
MTYFEKILVANRGEVAIRVMRACRETGIGTVAIYSEADRNALHVRYADEALSVGPAPSAKSYLNIERILDVAVKTGAEAVHPGYGFLAENPVFAKACDEADVVFIGPSWKTIEAMGSKIGSKRLMQSAGVPVLPGTPDGIDDPEAAQEIAREIGYPVIVKASAGGGGIGMQIVEDEPALAGAIEATQRHAASSFGDPTVMLEKYLVKPRHIEVQVFGDDHGHTVHLFERECSIQRRHQKLVEESPCPIMTPELRERMTASAVAAARACDYVNAGTVEFLYADGEYYFMEMNTRLQVEHTITELVTGVDIVRQQLAVAAGDPFEFGQDDLAIRGHAIECRINAEDPLNNFQATPGKILRYRSPGGPGVRLDSGVHQGYSISPYYDSMISKLCTWGMSRDKAIERMRRAISEYVILGVKTTLPLHYALMVNRHFVAGETHTHFLSEPHIQKSLLPALREEEARMQTLASSLRQPKEVAAISAALGAYLGTRPPG